MKRFLKQKKYELLGILVAVLALPSVTGAAFADGMAGALGEAYSNNPELEAQRALVRARDERVPQALANWRPTVSATAEIGKTRQEDNSNVETSQRVETRTPRKLALTVTQPVFRGFRTEAATDKAEALVLAERARLVDTEQNVLLDAARTYIQVWRDRVILGHNKQNEDSIRGILTGTKRRAELGERTQTDVQQAESKVARAEGDRYQAEGNLAASVAEYETVVGIAPGELDPPPMPPGLPTSLSEAVERAATNAPSVVAALYDAQAAGQTIKEVRGELLPTVSIQGTMSRAFEESANDNRIDDATIKLTASIPLYQGGGVYARIREAKQLSGRSKDLVDDARRKAIEAVTKGWQGMVSAQDRVRAADIQIAAAKGALVGTTRESEAGIRTVLDVLEAEEEVVLAETRKTRAEADVLISAYRLKAAMGELMIAELSPDIEEYKPEPHYQEVRNQWFGGRPPEEEPAPPGETAPGWAR